MTLRNSLQTYFNFTAFRPGQLEAIEHVLAGQHTLVVMPTGSGKSLVYQLAALHRPGVTLVVSPLIALMKDQVDSLTRRGIPATFINSALPGYELNARLRDLAEGAYRLAYIAPERLRSDAFQDILRRLKVGLLAVDEAHCLSHWGHDFRPDYLYIRTARREMGDPVTVALTATATPQVQRDIIQLLGLPSARRVITGFNRPNLTLEAHSITRQPTKLKAVERLLGRISAGAAIVYAGTRRDAEEVAQYLSLTAGLPAQYYHAGLEAETRARIQESFIHGDLSIIVATNAFGMGIDRPDVRLVVHYNIPGTLEAYYQEAGRAGRDSQPARAILLYTPSDRSLHEQFIRDDALSFRELRVLYDAVYLLNQVRSDMARADLASVSRLPGTKVKSGLARLEQAGIIQRPGDAAGRMRVQVTAWDETAMQAMVVEMEAHRRHRLAQLAQMIAYAESATCRRRILLDHFGDSTPAMAPRCCDNCLIRPSAPIRNGRASLSETDRTALAILDAVRRLPWGVSPARLTKVLQGVGDPDLQRLEYDQTLYFGRLRHLSQAAIDDLIEQLVSQRYFTILRTSQPILRLTPLGESAIQAQANIALRL